MYLRQEGDAWVVGNFERGVYRPFDRFHTEDEACRLLYEWITHRGPGPGPGSDEESAAILRDREEIQRAAREAYDRARRAES
jgi:hypothetical protein